MPRAPSTPSPNDVRVSLSLDLIVGLVTLTLVVSACSQPQPSEEYEEASRLFTEALVERGEPAVFSDDRAIEALELAELVDPKSLDSEAARFLAKRIRDGIEEASRRHADLAATRAAVREGLARAAGEAAGNPFAGGEGEEEEVEPSVGLPDVGAPASDFTRRYAGCIQRGAPFVETGGTRKGVSYSLADTDECREKHPEMEGMLVYIADDRVFNVGSESEATPAGAGEPGASEQPSGAPPAVAAVQEEEEVPEIVLERFDDPDIPDIVGEHVFIPGMPLE